MSTALDRENGLIREARDLAAFYRLNGQHSAIVRLFAEDYEFLLKRKTIIEFADGARLDGDVSVVKGPPRKKRISKKPPEY